MLPAVAGDQRARDAALSPNATLRNSIRIANRPLIGAGAVIMADTKEGSVHVAPRATVLRTKSDAIDL